jgi:hypothetical protein
LPNINSIECIGISIKQSNQQHLQIFCCYCPNSNVNSFRSDFVKLTNNNNNYVIGGDFNSRHQAWHCSRSNKGGRAIYDVLVNTDNVMIFRPDKPTYYSHAGTPSFLDLFFSNLSSQIINVSTFIDLNSDHLPIILEINSSPLVHSQPTYFDYKNADWDKFQEIIDLSLSSLDCNELLSSSNEIEDFAIGFSSIIDLAQLVPHPNQLLIENALSFQII